jgi:hypothetical protein
LGTKPIAGLAVLLGEVLLGVGRDQDGWGLARAGCVAPVNLLGERKAAFCAEIDIDERHVRAQLINQLKCFSAAGCRTDYSDPVALKQVHGRLYEMRVVVDDYAPQRINPRHHRFSLPAVSTGSIPATITRSHCLRSPWVRSAGRYRYQLGGTPRVLAKHNRRQAVTPAMGGVRIMIPTVLDI